MFGWRCMHICDGIPMTVDASKHDSKALWTQIITCCLEHISDLHSHTPCPRRQQSQAV